MNGRNDTVKNISICARCSSHVTKCSISSDISTLEIRNKNIKKTVLNYFIKFFIFAILIWILQYSNNLDSSKSCNYKSNIEGTLYFRDNRSLAECSEILKEKKEQSKANSKNSLKSDIQGKTTETSLQTRAKNNYEDMKVKGGREEEEKIVIEQLNVEDRTDRSERRNFKDIILGTCRNNPTLTSLYASAFLSGISGITITILQILSSAHIFFWESLDITMACIMFSAISLIIIISALIHNEKKTSNKSSL